MSQPQYQQPQQGGQPTAGPYAGNRYGSPQGNYQPIPASASTNPWAIASLVLALCATAIVAVIVGHIALAQINRTGEQGRGIAIAGLVIGYASIVGYLIFFASVIGFIAFARQSG